ncbi:MAG: pyruvate formate lyase-activating protein [Clostridia bacterium]|nr:pyruvate formate lyase-activating protein [Clostridia bacterium]
MTIGYLHSIESMGLVDGPGIRTVVFLSGCMLRCQYCHNPDMWAEKEGTPITPSELVEKLVRYKSYYQASGGGVTFSGGDPLLQPAFLAETLQKCRQNGIHTCLDTAGAGLGAYDEILSYTDLVLYDIKHYQPAEYRALTGRDIAQTEQFLAAVQAHGIPLWLRHVVVPGLTDSESHLRALADYIRAIQNVQKVELLGYHTLGVPKYQSLGVPYPLAGVAPLVPDALAHCQSVLDQSLRRQPS